MKQALPDSTGFSPMEFSFTFEPKNGRKNFNHSQDKIKNAEPGNVPRISRLMALAIRFDGLVKRGELRDYADLARLGYVTRARITRIMNLQPGAGHPGGSSPWKY